MKEIGSTPGNGSLVELSHREMVCLRRIAQVADGATMNDLLSMRDDTMTNDRDLTKPFEAIIAWMEVQEHANALRNLAVQIERTTHYTKNTGAHQP